MTFDPTISYLMIHDVTPEEAIEIHRKILADCPQDALIINNSIAYEEQRLTSR